MSTPKFSIITVCLNSEKTIERTMLSVFNQDYKDYEYIIIDGGSKDRTVEVIKKYKDKIKYFISEKDLGVYNAMNKGASMARGDYLYFLNSGDSFFDKSILKEVSEELDNVDMVYGKVRVVDRNGNGKYIKSRRLNKISLRLGRKVGQQAVFVKRDVFKRVDGLNERYKIAADFDLLCKIIDNDFFVKKINEIICDYDNSGISSDLKKSYNDTALVIRDRYGIFWYSIYFVFSKLKLIIAKVYFGIRNK